MESQCWTDAILVGLITRSDSRTGALTVPVLGYIGRLGRRPETKHADRVGGC